MRTEDRRRRALERMPTLAALPAGVLGLASLALTRLAPSLDLERWPMQGEAPFAAALVLACAALAGWSRDPKGWRRAVSWACAGAVFAVGTAALLAALPHIRADAQSPAWMDAWFPGGMRNIAPALEFVLLGLSLAILPTQLGNQLAQFLTLTMMVVAGFSLSRYVPMLHGLQDLGAIAPLPLHKSLAFLLLGAGLIAEHQRRILRWMETERARARTDAALNAAQDLAHSLERYKSDFLVNVSHEFRTPMNGIVGMMEALDDTRLDPAQREYVRTARESAVRLLDTLKTVMSFWEGQSGVLTYEPAACDVRRTILDAAHKAVRLCRAKGLELAVVVPPDLPAPLVGDSHLIQAVLLQLLSNAVKFTERGEVTVTVVKTGESDREVNLRFFVSDTGRGVEPGLAKRLFEPFSQADSTPTRRFGGLGLGLPLSRWMVELMGGQIGVQGEGGRGATFWFSCVLGKTAKTAKTVVPLEGRAALVVAPSSPLQSTLPLQLGVYGLSIESADTSADAVEMMTRRALRAKPYAFVFVNEECGAAGVDRVAATARAGMTATRVVLLRSPSLESSSAPLPAGIDSAIDKPASPAELDDVLLGLSGLRPRKPAAAVLRRGSRILVVDDDRVNLRVATLMLKKLGLSSETAANGAEAVAKVRAAPYDLVLMDCQMPEMDGYQATGAIRQLEAGRRRTPIVALTANALKSDRKKCLDAGMDDYLSKPISAEELRAVLDKFCASEEGAQPGAPALPAASPVFEPSPAARPAAAPAVSAAAAPAVQATAVADAVDPGKIKELRDLGGDELVIEIVKTFLGDEAPACLTALREAVCAGNAEGTRQAAHKLKGCAGAVGAKRLSSEAHQLEQMGAQSRLDGSAEKFNEILSEFERVYERLQQVAG